MNERQRRIADSESALLRSMSDAELEALAAQGPVPDMTHWTDDDLERVINGGPLPTRGSRRF